MGSSYPSPHPHSLVECLIDKNLAVQSEVLSQQDGQFESLIEMKNLRPHPPSYWVRICILTSSLGNFHAHQSLRSTGLENTWLGIA